MPRLKSNYQPGAPVWARVAGYPWWPARVITAAEARRASGRPAPEPRRDEHLVEFFNDGRRFACTHSRFLRHFHDPRHRDIDRSRKQHVEHLEVAFEQAKRYCTDNAWARPESPRVSRPRRAPASQHWADSDDEIPLADLLAYHPDFQVDKDPVIQHEESRDSPADRKIPTKKNSKKRKRPRAASFLFIPPKGKITAAGRHPRLVTQPPRRQSTRHVLSPPLPSHERECVVTEALPQALPNDASRDVEADHPPHHSDHPVVKVEDQLFSGQPSDTLLSGRKETRPVEGQERGGTTQAQSRAPTCTTEVQSRSASGTGEYRSLDKEALLHVVQERDKEIRAYRTLIWQERLEQLKAVPTEEDTKTADKLREKCDDVLKHVCAFLDTGGMG